MGGCVMYVGVYVCFVCVCVSESVCACVLCVGMCFVCSYLFISCPFSPPPPPPSHTHI